LSRPTSSIPRLSAMSTNSLIGLTFISVKFIN
jgi:hypothetical protein